MNKKALFDNISLACSKHITQKYSTSFSLGIRCLHSDLRGPIYSVYGFVRIADEIVDTFHDYDKETLLKEFKEETYKALDQRISTNPVLNSFQQAVHDFNIDYKHIDTFLKSMEMDLNKKEYDPSQYEEYILGSAEVVGLMCLKIFCYGDQEQYDKLEPYAMRLGSAFQKVNFLRDLKDDIEDLGRFYFPNLVVSDFNDDTKREIEKEIEEDFKYALKGIVQLPKSSRFGVYLAYVYYSRLFQKIKNTPHTKVMEGRIRIPNPRKLSLFASTYVKHQLNLLN
ncbi:phytoene/squalene synthase family protein [Sediminitomix flava]|uniref:Phytoene/squalene synthetase n=1 Tax=Sediminitomix flava TaxID=379075 RepID=A0A315Z4Q7_SEDFL|nr:phytoene/squalene synthase family protein [Sediminitomix flava]PWJ38458.1 phytoene/squalene synthetase [Sediminitomix flava]